MTWIPEDFATAVRGQSPALVGREDAGVATLGTLCAITWTNRGNLEQSASPTSNWTHLAEMWTHCIVCSGELGENQDVEPFPIGQKLAYDAAKGRLWVICPKCSRWNLTPIEERWEAVETLEHLWEHTSSKASTDHISLGLLPSGLSIVRVGGSAGEREYAFWRWGSRGANRFLKPILYGSTAIVGMAAGVTLLPPITAAVGAALAIHAGIIGYAYQQGLVATGMIGPTGEIGFLKKRDFLNAGMNPKDDDLGWSIHLQQTGFAEVERRAWWGTRTYLEQRFYWKEFTGARAQAVARRAFPLLNARHAPDQVVSDAIAMIAEAGGPETYLRRAAAQKPRWVKFRHYPTPMKLALEMVLFEESERAALEGELEELEAAWREAENLAAISDDLIQPKNWAKEKARLESLGATEVDNGTRRGGTAHNE